MKINKIRWKNFTSWGNAWNEMDFSGKPGLSLIYGENGAGKSSIPNLIIYMLYGQIDGFTQKDIPNRINRHFEGEIFLESKNRNVHIYRALSPNSFKVTIDGESIDTAGKNNVQKWVEEEIYGIPYAIFRNSIVLSVNDFKSFADLSPKEKREIIDRMFGYHVINSASAKVKEAIKNTEYDITECEGSINGYESSIRDIDNAISDLKTHAETEPVVESELARVKSELTENAREYKRITPEITDFETILIKEESEKSGMHMEMSGIREKLGLYSKGICPLCGSPLDTHEHTDEKNRLESRLSELETGYRDICGKINETKAVLSESVSQKEKLVAKINALKVEKTRYETAILERSKANDEQLSRFAGMRENLLGKIAPKREELSKMERKRSVLEIVSGIFSENGLKQYISDIYVPVINAYVEDVCAKLGIAYKVSFTTGYDCAITFMGEDVPYRTLSNGERKKIDIAVTLAFLKIIKTKISDINILFLDEVLSSIDVSSCNEMLRIFHDFSNDSGLRIYMVHHANLDSTWVSDMIGVEKQNGFSHFV